MWWWYMGLLVCIECHSSNNEISNGHNNNKELDYVFHKYANNSNLMSSYQLVHFVNQFELIFLNELQTNSSCFSLKLNNLLNQTKMLKNDTIINRVKFDKLSSYLVSFIDICLSQNEFNSSIFSENHHYHVHKHASNWDTFLENISKINKESKTF